MPLRITIDNQYGHPADYWVIVEINVNFARPYAHVVIEGWASKAKYLAGKHSIDARMYDFSAEDWPFADGRGNLLRAAYDKIKTLPPFTQATEEA